ncbi:hypothetical protein VB776_09975 [Arcicella sp. DC2W]|uniref:Lipoprotein n=1 Tax=Arcicella gelida TaxID=2984195 RepID=A0ABU5S418_9BACT|nr:hypothetical protein [Arcicella sp. DC2W]MEA5403242.1 hypothetical protein [Arcicella sp. DC2W]
MKNQFFSLLVILLLSSSCASVKFYSDKELKNESGIEFYSPKPYLIVEKSPAKDVAIKSTIVYLPDFEKSKFAKIKSGFGSSDLKLSLEHGIITSYGVTTDTKIPETLTAISSLVSGVGSAYKTVKEVTEKEKEEDGDITSMQNAVKIIIPIVDGFQKIKGEKNSLLSEPQNNKVVSLADTLENAQKKLNGGKPKDIPSIVISFKNADNLLDELKTTSDSPKAKDYNSKIDSYKKELEKALNILSPAPAKTDTTAIEIYEIVIANGKTELHKVNMP